MSVMSILCASASDPPRPPSPPPPPPPSQSQLRTSPCICGSNAQMRGSAEWYWHDYLAEIVTGIFANHERAIQLQQALCTSHNTHMHPHSHMCMHNLRILRMRCMTCRYERHGSACCTMRAAPSHSSRSMCTHTHACTRVHSGMRSHVHARTHTCSRACGSLWH